MVVHRAYNRQFRGSASAFHAYAMEQFRAGDMHFSKGGLTDEMNRMDAARR